MMLKKAAGGLQRHIQLKNTEMDGPKRNNIFAFLKLAFKWTIAVSENNVI